MISKRVVYSLSAAFSLAISIFLKKKVLLLGYSTLNLLTQFMIVSATMLSLNLFLFQKKSREELKKITQREWILLSFGGFSLLSAYLFSTYGLNYTTSINYSFLNRSTLIFTAILAFFLLNERMYRGKMILILGFFLGIYLFATEGKMFIPKVGDILILIGSFFFSLVSIIQKKMSKNLSPDTITWGITLNGGMFAALIGFILQANFVPQNGFSLVLIIGLAEGLVLFFMNKTVQITTATYYAMMAMLIPIISSFFGIIFLKESLSPIQIIGGSIIIFSGLLAQYLKS